MLGATAFTRNDHIFLGNCPAEHIEGVLRHELVHVAQAELALRTGRVSSRAAIESEACAISGLPVAHPVRSGAAPDRIYRFVWFVAIGVGLYILLRPGVANAPAVGGKTYARPSLTRITAEAVCFFAVPGGAFSLGGRLGLGFLASSALAGAAANVSLRVTDDVARGEASPPLMYLFDALTGAVIGFVVPGGVRLIGKGAAFGFNRVAAGAASGFDSLATFGLSQSDIALTRLLAEEAAKAPLVAADAQRILQQRGLAGQVSQWWLNRRGIIVLYRGQEMATNRILSPLARQQNVAASEALVARLRQEGLSYEEIAGYTARWHTQAVPAFAAPPGLDNVPLGSVGIPTTQIPGIAANFGEGGVIYVIRVPSNLAIKPITWQGLALENEHIILNQVPPGAIVQVIPASRVAPLMVDENGLLVPGNRGLAP